MEKVKKEDIVKLECRIAYLEAANECSQRRLEHFIDLVMELKREIYVLKHPDQKLFLYDPVSMIYKRMEV